LLLNQNQRRSYVTKKLLTRGFKRKITAER
jgi:hypothetical protein